MEGSAAKAQEALSANKAKDTKPRAKVLVKRLNFMRIKLLLGNDNPFEGEGWEFKPTRKQ
jgi:hypothetical protein